MKKSATIIQRSGRFLLLSAALCLSLTACVHQQDKKPEPILATTPAADSEQADAVYQQFDAEFDALSDIPEPKDETLWNRVIDGFELKTDLKQKRLQTQIDWFSSHPAYMYRVMSRAEPFLYYILQEAEKRDMPTELVLLPIVESAFQPFAYSHGRAAGIWQFIPSTGKLYGLKQNWWYDGRRDIHASTQAALKYLDNLNKMFKGDWLLALAAYNSGPGNVQKAVRQNRRKGRPTDFWHLKLPLETRTYVPKLLALKELVQHPELYDVSLRCIPSAPGFKQVDAGSQIDLALAAEVADIDIETLYKYNPAFNRWATPPEGPHTLILPAEAAQTFEQNIDAIPADQRVSWKRHKIKEGQTLSHIALKYKTTVKELRKINHIRSKYIRAGKHILVPASRKSSNAYALSASQRLKATQGRKRGNNTTRIDHVVKNGESFWEIARDYNVSMHKLARWNGMAVRDRLRAGQKLVIWTKKPGSAARSGSIQKLTHTVRNGDSLSRIASRYRVTVTDLHRWNSIKGKYLQPGQKIRVYVDVTQQSGNT